MDHLLHVFGVKWHSEFKLLSKVMMEINKLARLNGMRLSILETIKVLLQ
jgi:hypothetical protein